MSAAGHLLADFRKARRLSQLELGLLASVSARHLSFIETGRACPSREMLLRLAEALELPHREANQLLAAGGYAPAYSHSDLDSPEMQPVREALEIMLANHAPFPAVVLDACWNVLLANRVQQAVFASVLGAANPSVPLNILELIFDPAGLRPVIVNWPAVAGRLLRRLHRQLMMFPQPRHEALLQRLLDMDPPPDWQQPPVQGLASPMITVDLDLQGQRLRMFSTISRFGTALDVGAQELLIENYFPADEPTRAFFTNAFG